MNPENQEEAEASKKINDWLELSETSLVVLLAETAWSGGARIMEESLTTIANSSPEVISDNFDVEVYPSIKDHFNVQQIPSTVFLRNGEVIHLLGGTVSRRKLSAAIEKYLTP